MDEEKILSDLVGIIELPTDRETGRQLYRAYLVGKSCVVGTSAEITSADRIEVVEGRYYDDAKGEVLIQRAFAGDRDAEAVLYIIASLIIEKGIALPPNLGTYVGAFLWLHVDEIGPEVGDKYRNFSRDQSIGRCLGYLLVEHGINHKATAMGLVHRALQKSGYHISRDGLRKIIARLFEREKNGT